MKVGKGLGQQEEVEQKELAALGADRYREAGFGLRTVPMLAELLAFFEHQASAVLVLE